MLRRRLCSDGSNVGGEAERRNIDVVREICQILDQAIPRSDGSCLETLITYVDDRPGHDHRYAIDNSKIRTEIGWKPSVTFEEGLSRTVEWYLSCRDWWEPLMAERYDGRRLGTQRRDSK